MTEKTTLHGEIGHSQYEYVQRYIAMCSASEEISFMIRKCKDEKDIDKQISILKELNTLLPLDRRIALQSLYTRDYIQRVLSWIEEISVEGLDYRAAAPA